MTRPATKAPVTKAMVRTSYEMLDAENPDKSFPWIVSVIESMLECSYEFIVDVLSEGQCSSPG
jgi:hypothetical protein